MQYLFPDFGEYDSKFILIDPYARVLITQRKVASVQSESETLLHCGIRYDGDGRGSPFTCLTHRSAYLSVLMVLDLTLLLFSDGKCIFSSFSVFKSSFCVFALADCSLLQGGHETDTHASETTRSRQCRHSPGSTAFQRVANRRWRRPEYSGMGGRLACKNSHSRLSLRLRRTM